jgi:hypothetical protein
MNNMNPDQLEVAPGFEHERLEGVVWQIGSEEDLRAGLEKAFDYRGDVTIAKKDGSQVEGYIFDRQAGLVRLMPKDGRGKVSISYAEIAGLAFTGKDTAAGKSWEAWVKKYNEKKASGEQQIALEPESLD